MAEFFVLPEGCWTGRYVQRCDEFTITGCAVVVNVAASDIGDDPTELETLQIQSDQPWSKHPSNNKRYADNGAIFWPDIW